MNGKRSGEIRPDTVAVFLKHLIPLHRIALLEKRGEATLAHLKAKRKAQELMAMGFKALTEDEKSLVKAYSATLASGRIDLSDRDEHIAEKVLAMVMR